ncbi:MAG: L-histidine N(alpha)-methyltransferase [Acidimicrobiia bacterium]
MPSTTPSISITTHLGPDEWREALRSDVQDGLTLVPKDLPPTWLYDERGCDLFEQITTLPEYYPTRAERAILAVRADEIAAVTGADTLVELGSGTSEKTRLLLDAFYRSGRLERFVPFDCALGALADTAESIASEYPGTDVEGIVGDFHRHLGRLPGGGRRIVAFLGGTIGNLQPAARAALLADLVSAMVPGDSLLLGTDLIKDRGRLLAAYDDGAGVTAAFNKNLLAVLNRELGADFDLDRFEHVARFDEDNEWIEMRLRSLGDQVVHVEALDLTVAFVDGEEMRTEISAKFRPERVKDELEAAGLRLERWWTDPAGDFGLSLSML